ncbi:uncharacterized protein LOC120104816 [Phoenix dactylifera]|uniref:Uncharacterized protein LOC120104816 n=1 Tax=Phoenix dactylifera TaxID=42345 RepID=A0A8B8ZM49_PHODC|nr:uncharacterized protein LOC120104816 [Phoenix dactylifera]
MQRRFDDVVEVDDDVLEEVRKPWKTSAVLIRSLGRVVPAEWVVKELRRVMELPEPPEIFPLLEGFFVVRFSCEEHREKALSWGPWLVAGQIHAMERWRPNFSPGAGELNKAIVWLRMPGLPLDYWEESIILQMAAKAGKPLAVDEITEQGKKRGFARVKIEVDLRLPLRGGTFVKGKAQGREERVWQGFIFENLPNPCCRCGRVGHGEGFCAASPVEVPVDGGTEVVTDEQIGTPENSSQGGAGGNATPGNPGYGPWLVTHRVRQMRAGGGNVKPRKPMVSECGQNPAGTPSRTKTPPADGESTPSVSPVDLDGWQKPSKVARRKSPEQGKGECSNGHSGGGAAGLRPA